MKTLDEYLAETLDSELEAITATELRYHLGECLTQAAFGKAFCIWRKGKIVAFLVPPGSADVIHTIESDGSCPTLASCASRKCTEKEKNYG